MKSNGEQHFYHRGHRGLVMKGRSLDFARYDGSGVILSERSVSKDLLFPQSSVTSVSSVVKMQLHLSVRSAC